MTEEIRLILNITWLQLPFLKQCVVDSLEQHCFKYYLKINWILLWKPHIYHTGSTKEGTLRRRGSQGRNNETVIYPGRPLSPPSPPLAAPCTNPSLHPRHHYLLDTTLSAADRTWETGCRNNWQQHYFYFFNIDIYINKEIQTNIQTRAYMYCIFRITLIIAWMFASIKHLYDLLKRANCLNSIFHIGLDFEIL